MVAIYLTLLGLLIGSFINAFVWRVHEQTSSLKNKNNPELSIIRGRSMCPSCHHKLASKDLIPVLSWILLKGKCSYCHKPISILYPIFELLTAFIFGFSFIIWNNFSNSFSILSFILWLVILTGLIALALYDIKWYILPTRIIYSLAPIILLFVIVRSLYLHNYSLIFGSIYGLVILGGLFYLIFQISKGKWIGGGDIRLGFLLGFLVGGPLSAILLLFIASFTGTIISLPLISLNKLSRKSTIPFGPFLIFGAIVVVLFGSSIINWYKNKLLI